MIAAGLLVSENVPVSFDRFRDRVIFPITDFRGRIVAFGGRALSADVPAKYLNSPETELFHKGALLYNGATARHAAHDAGTVVAVEGYVDVVRMVAAGFAHTVAPLGTALTERQLQILWRMADEPILCFDGDSAGLRAANRAADLAMPLLLPGKSLRFALLPPGLDPDDLIRASGADAMRAILAAARPLVDLVWGRETDSGVFDTPERRAALEARLREIARADRRRECAPPLQPGLRRPRSRPSSARASGTHGPVRSPNYRGPRSEYRGRDPRFPSPVRPLASGIPVSDRLRRSQMLAGRATLPFREIVLVMTMVNHPALLARHLDDFAHLEFSHGDLDRLRDGVLEIVAHGEAEDAGELAKALAARGLAPLVERLSAQLADHGPVERACRGHRRRCGGGLAPGFDLAPAQADVT